MVTAAFQSDHFLRVLFLNRVNPFARSFILKLLEGFRSCGDSVSGPTQSSPRAPGLNNFSFHTVEGRSNPDPASESRTRGQSSFQAQ